MQTYEQLDQDELIQRFPQLEPGPTAWGILEPDSGVLLARRAVQAVVAQAQAIGVDYLEEAIAPPQTYGKAFGSDGFRKGDRGRTVCVCVWSMVAEAVS